MDVAQQQGSVSEPNPSRGVPSTPDETPTSAMQQAAHAASAQAATGDLADSQTAGRAKSLTVPRVLRVELQALPDEDWHQLRALAQQASRFGNALLADKYAQAKGYTPRNDQSAFIREGGGLSGDVRVAIQGEVQAVWARHSKKILIGEQRLALFDATRVLVCRAGQMSVEHRRSCQAERRRGRPSTCACPHRARRCIWIYREGSQYVMSGRLLAEPKPRQTFRLRWKPQSDAYISPMLERLADGKTRLLKVSWQFERPGRKVFALLTYEAHVIVPPAGQRHATFGPIEPNGECWLRVDGDDGRWIQVNYTNRVKQLIEMKLHFEAIYDRLKRGWRKAGPRALQEKRRALVRSGSFSAWAHGPLHAWSADIIARCQRHGVGYLAIGDSLYQGLPMARLQAMLTYKAEATGIHLAPFDPMDGTTDRAVKRPVEKQRRSIVAKHKALKTLRKGLTT